MNWGKLEVSFRKQRNANKLFNKCPGTEKAGGNPGKDMVRVNTWRETHREVPGRVNHRG